MPTASPRPDPTGHAGELTVSQRQCGRCRMMFKGDPTLNAKAMPEWWLCPPCRATLFGDAAGRPAAAAPAASRAPSPLGR